MKKLLLAERYPIMMDSIKEILSQIPKTTIICTALEGHHLQNFILVESPDILILDVEQCFTSANTFCKALNKGLSDLAILLVFGDAARVEKKLNYKSGIRGAILKTATAEEFRNAVEKILRRETYTDRDIERAMASSQLFSDPLPIGKKQGTRSIRISRRETEVLQLIVDENTTSEIAGKLFITPCTAEAHRMHLIQKFGVKNTAGLVREAIFRQFV